MACVVTGSSIATGYSDVNIIHKELTPGFRSGCPINEDSKYTVTAISAVTGKSVGLIVCASHPFNGIIVRAAGELVGGMD